MLRALTDKADNLQEERDGQCKQREGNSKKEPNQMLDEEHHTERKITFDGLIW